MAGMKCPKCSEFTFFETPKGRKCTKCGYEMVVPPNQGKGGKGALCTHCGEYRVFNGKCAGCGATYL